MTDENALIRTRLDVAEMKGMLTQALSDHGQRITNLERDNVDLHSRLSDKAKILAGHSERITGLEKATNRNETAIETLENDNRTERNARVGKITSVIAVIISGVGLLTTLIVNSII